MSDNNRLFFGAIAFLAVVGLTAAYALVISLPVPSYSNQLTAAGSSSAPSVAPSGESQEVNVKIENFRYTPSRIQVAAGKPIRFTITRIDEEGCGNALTFYGLKKATYLPLGQAVSFDLPPLEKGQFLEFGCGMRMVVGRLEAL